MGALDEARGGAAGSYRVRPSSSMAQLAFQISAGRSRGPLACPIDQPKWLTAVWPGSERVGRQGVEPWTHGL